MSAEPPGPDAEAMNFATSVEPLRLEVCAVLDVESAQNGLGFKDRGISIREGGSWIATVWRKGDGGDTLEITCTRGLGERWQVTMVPLNAERPMCVLNWPGKNFQAMLRAAVSDLGT